MRLFMMMILLLCGTYAMGQVKGMDYKFYGFIRADLFYNSRQSVAPVDGNFYLFPLDRAEDARGQDLNAQANANFICYTSRLGLNIKGPQWANGRVSANVEVDFGGAGKVGAVLRLRKAYVACDWELHRILVGQIWHPLFGQVVPDVSFLVRRPPRGPMHKGTSPIVDVPIPDAFIYWNHQIKTYST